MLTKKPIKRPPVKMQIESQPEIDKKEIAGYKYPREKVTFGKKGRERNQVSQIEFLKQLKKGGGTSIHTHIYNNGSHNAAYPSITDLRSALNSFMASNFKQEYTTVSSILEDKKKETGRSIIYLTPKTKKAIIDFREKRFVDFLKLNDIYPESANKSIFKKAKLFFLKQYYKNNEENNHFPMNISIGIINKSIYGRNRREAWESAERNLGIRIKFIAMPGYKFDKKQGIFKIK